MTLYKGSQQIRDTGSYGVYKGSTPIGAIFKGSEKVYMFQREITYSPSDSFQTYTVPNYVTKIHVDCVASKGYTGNASGGNGGRVQCDLNVTGGQTLYIVVGNMPTSQSNIYNASDIRTNNDGITNNTSLSTRLVVAGGGGSGGSYGGKSGYGGAGGGLTGGNGEGREEAGGGTGGTQSTGGAGGGLGGMFGTQGNPGAFGLGGASPSNQGGAGGAGWYGGGSGARYNYSEAKSGGGGGGSSYTNSTLCSNITHTQGYQNGAGYITITEIE